MHKKLEAELIHLAHQILKVDNNTDISELRDKARIIYENLSVLSFIDNYFVETPSVTDSKDDFLEKLNNLVAQKQTKFTVADNVEEEILVEIPNKKEEINKVAESTPIVDTPINEVLEEKIIEETVIEETVIEENIIEEVEAIEEVSTPISKESVKAETEQLIETTINTIQTEAKEIAAAIQEKPQDVEIPEEKNTLEEELKHSIPVDVAANMFEKAENMARFNRLSASELPKVEEPAVINKVETPKPIVVKPKVNIATKQEVPPTPSKMETSLNDRIFNQKIQVGLNDRIAFVKHLFNFSQEDFNRVLSQLNTFDSEQACKDFLNNQVKPDYDWSRKEEYEERLMTLIERKFK